MSDVWEDLGGGRPASPEAAAELRQAQQRLFDVARKPRRCDSCRRPLDPEVDGQFAARHDGCPPPPLPDSYLEAAARIRERAER